LAFAGWPVAIGVGKRLKVSGTIVTVSLRLLYLLFLQVLRLVLLSSAHPRSTSGCWGSSAPADLDGLGLER
jgi:hypothetical protein